MKLTQSLCTPTQRRQRRSGHGKTPLCFFNLLCTCVHAQINDDKYRLEDAEPCPSPPASPLPRRALVTALPIGTAGNTTSSQATTRDCSEEDYRSCDYQSPGGLVSASPLIPDPDPPTPSLLSPRLPILQANTADVSQTEWTKLMQ